MFYCKIHQAIIMQVSKKYTERERRSTLRWWTTTQAAVGNGHQQGEETEIGILVNFCQWCVLQEHVLKFQYWTFLQGPPLQLQDPACPPKGVSSCYNPVKKNIEKLVRISCNQKLYYTVKQELLEMVKFEADPVTLLYLQLIIILFSIFFCKSNSLHRKLQILKLDRYDKFFCVFPNGTSRCLAGSKVAKLTF